MAKPSGPESASETRHADEGADRASGVRAAVAAEAHVEAGRATGASDDDLPAADAGGEQDQDAREGPPPLPDLPELIATELDQVLGQGTAVRRSFVRAEVAVEHARANGLSVDGLPTIFRRSAHTRGPVHEADAQQDERYRRWLAQRLNTRHRVPRVADGELPEFADQVLVNFEAGGSPPPGAEQIGWAGGLRRFLEPIELYMLESEVANRLCGQVDAPSPKGGRPLGQRSDELRKDVLELLVVDPGLTPAKGGRAKLETLGYEREGADLRAPKSKRLYDVRLVSRAFSDQKALARNEARRRAAEARERRES